MTAASTPRARHARPELGFPLSLISRLGDPYRVALIPLSTEGLMRSAERITGLHDFGDDGGFRTRVEQAVESLLRIDWNLIGRQAVRTNVLWHLTNRLRLVHLLKTHPEVRSTPIEPPIVVLGLFRTGSTFLHNVLAADPALRAGYNWEFSYPAGRPSRALDDDAWRRRRTWLTMNIAKAMVPDQDEVHELETNQYEEDFFLLENDFANLKFVVGLGDFAYAWELLGADLTSAYDWHKLQLQILAHGRPRTRWLLKSPWHLWNLEFLVAAYPDAKIIHTHREVADAIASQCSLTARIACRLQRDLDPSEVGRFGLRYARAGLERGLAVRDRLPESQVFDVRLSDIRRAPEPVLRSLYRHLELPHDDDTIARLVARAAMEPKLQSGIHAYSIEDFGLTAAEVESELGFYASRFGLRRERGGANKSR